MRGAIGAGLAIALTGWLTRTVIGDDSGLPWLVASMGASAVLAVVLPASPLAQPWPVIGVHLIAGVIGLACHALPLPGWLGSCESGGQPVDSADGPLPLPASARGRYGSAGGAGQSGDNDNGLAFPASAAGLNLALLVIAALVFNRLTGHPYPHHARPVPVPPVLAGRYTSADLDAVLEEWDEVLSVDRDDIDSLLRAVESRVLMRSRDE